MFHFLLYYFQINNGFTQKIGDFFDVAVKKESFADLNFMRDLVVFTSVGSSFVMILTALGKYVYQCKGTNINFTGRMFLAVYFACFIVCRLTLFVAMIATAVPAGYVIPDSIVAGILALAHFVAIAWFKVRVASLIQRKTGLFRLIGQLNDFLLTRPPRHANMPPSFYYCSADQLENLRNLLSLVMVSIFEYRGHK